MFPRVLPPFQSVPTTGNAIIPDLPQGMSYAGIMLTLGGTTFTKAMLDGIYLTLGGKEVWNGLTGTQMNTINLWNGITTDATHLWLGFSDIKAKTSVGYDIGAIDTSVGYKDFQLRCHIAGATAPTLQATAYVMPPLPRDAQYKNVFRTLRSFAPAITGANTFDTKAPMGGDHAAYLRAVHYFHANLTHLEVKKDGVNLLDKLTIAEIQAIQAMYGRSAQAGLASWDAVLLNDQFQSVPTLKKMDGGKYRQSDFEHKATASASDNVSGIVDCYADVNAF